MDLLVNFSLRDLTILQLLYFHGHLTYGTIQELYEARHQVEAHRQNFRRVCELLCERGFAKMILLEHPVSTHGRPAYKAVEITDRGQEAIKKFQEAYKKSLGT